MFEFEHENPPAAFDPLARARGVEVVMQMEADGFYDNHTRQECAIEYHKRYEKLKGEGK